MKPLNLLPCDGNLYDFGVLPELDASALVDLPWQNEVVTIFGKTHRLQRQSLWMGDEDAVYAYSGHVRVPMPWNTAVTAIKQAVESRLEDADFSVKFNACLLNHYPSGADGMGYHSDNEPELGLEPVIASVSLGASRRFLLRHQSKPERLGLTLQHGQLIVMSGATQQHWKHALPKTKRMVAQRYNLTFRRIIQTHRS